MSAAPYDELAESPEYREAKAELDRAEQRMCSEGACVEFIDPETGKDLGGWGPVGCPCQDDE